MDVRGVEEFCGVGLEEVSTPPLGMKRRRMGSEGSPNEVEEREGVVENAVEEMRGYLAKNFAPKHLGFFEKRFRVIAEAQGKLEVDARRSNQVAERLAQVERAVKSLGELDWGKEVVNAVRDEVQTLCTAMIEAVVGRSRELSERIRTQVDGALDTMTAHDAERGKDVERVEAALRESMGKVVKEVKTVAREWEAGRGLMTDLRANLDRVGERVVAVHEVVGPLERNVVRQVDRRLEGMNVEKVGERVASMVENAVSKVEAARNVERMDVDGEGEWAKVVRRGKRGPRVIVEVPGAKDFEERRNGVARCLDPKGGEVRVRGMRRKGKDVVVEVHDASDVEKLKECGKLRESGMKVKGMEGWRSPRVKIFDVAGEVSKGELAECVLRRNPELFAGMNEEERGSAFVPELPVRRANGLCEWVVRVNGRMFSRLMTSGRIFVGLRACRVVEHLGVRRCGKCHRFGHSGGRCDMATVCGFCGVEGHHAARCNKRPEEAKCINCVRFGCKEVGHPVFWPGCPVASMQKEQVKRNTSYEHGC